MRRSLALLLLGAAVLLPGCARGPSDSGCREDFGEYHASMTGYGNPGTSALPTLSARWDSLESAFGRLSRTARGEDCDDIDRLKQTVQSVELILLSIDDYDMVAQLAEAEAALADSQKAGELDPVPADLADELDVLRVLGPSANAALATQLGALDRADPLDNSRVAAAQDTLAQAADDSDEVERCRRALEVLARYDLVDYEREFSY